MPKTSIFNEKWFPGRRPKSSTKRSKNNATSLRIPSWRQKASQGGRGPDFSWFVELLSRFWHDCGMFLSFKNIKNPTRCATSPMIVRLRAGVFIICWSRRNHRCRNLYPTCKGQSTSRTYGAGNLSTCTLNLEDLWKIQFWGWKLWNTWFGRHIVLMLWRSLNIHIENCMEISTIHTGFL